MTIESTQDMGKCKPAICTLSLGRCFAGHALPHRLDMARNQGFRGVEIFLEDIETFARDELGDDSSKSQEAAAQRMRGLCADRGLNIVTLQAITSYEGLLDRKEHARRLDFMRFLIELAQSLGTDIILMPSTTLPAEQLSDDPELMVQDMIELADIGLSQSPPIRFAWEGLCWGTKVNTWEACYDIVQRVDRPNFGMCLDIFNLNGGVYADPAVPSGRTPNAEHDFAKTMERLASGCNLDKIFYVQVCDAERLAEPLNSTHRFFVADQPARMSWSRNCRLFYKEPELGGYLPVQEVLHTILSRAGWRGWLCFEIFNKRITETDSVIPEETAIRAAKSWARIQQDFPDAVEPLSKIE